MDNLGLHLKDVIRGKTGWARGWVTTPVQGPRWETVGAKGRAARGAEGSGQIQNKRKGNCRGRGES